MADRLEMQTKDITEINIQKIAEIFPSCVTETKTDDGKTRLAVDFESLKRQLSDAVIPEGKERYIISWPGKSEAQRLANSPTTLTLRPCIDKSSSFADTKNIYIEGDNLDALKLLRETYLGKVKMIYIDPPYNTGNDFLYNDKFESTEEEYKQISGDYDELGQRMVLNTRSNGKYHTDWLNMIYPRLILARDLLSDDGVIFISIDDNEQANLTKVCDEVFGSSNAIGPFIQNKQNTKNDTVNIQKNHEYILVYRKAILLNGSQIVPTLVRKEKIYRDVYKEGERYYYLNDPITTRGDGGTLVARPNLGYTVYYNPITNDIIPKMDYNPEFAKSSNDINVVYTDDQELIKSGYIAIRPPSVRGKLGCWTWSMEKILQEKDNIKVTGRPGSYTVKKRTFVDAKDVIEKDGKLQYISETNANSRSILEYPTSAGTLVLKELLNEGSLFNNPKNVEMIKYFISLIDDKNAIILDFFAGSSTTAQAVMEMNSEDEGNRQFIMIQLDEQCDIESDAYKKGYKTISEIGIKRIINAGKIINKTSNTDCGFRVFKVDSSNMNDVFYDPTATRKEILDYAAENIKSDRSGQDLLIQVMLELGIELSADIQEEGIASKTVFTVDGDYLIACFDSDVDDDLVTEIAKRQPRYAVFRDSSMSSDSVAINFGEIFKTFSPNTQTKVL